MRQALALAMLLFVIFFGCSEAEETDDAPHNVLFITIDDLRPEPGCYGNTTIKTPHLDALAAEAFLFERAYCQQALCNPSRSSLLTGLRPQTLGVFDGSTHFRENHPGLVTLPQLFKDNGYRAFSFGKVFHHRDSLSWHAPSWVPEPVVSYPLYQEEANLAFQRSQLKQGAGTPKSASWWAAGGHWIPARSWEAPEVSDTILFDGQITNKAIKKLTEVQAEAFFLAVGYFRPHIPPKKYFDLYPLDTVKLPDRASPPEGAPSVALTNWGETRLYHDIPEEGEISDTRARETIRAYYASVSYVDAQVGRLVAALKAQGLYDRTIIVVLGDHGYHLGDLGLWGKYTNFENATRVPLILRVPKKSPQHIENIIELIDVYPTLAHLCRLNPPGGLEGHSFHALLNKTSTEYTDSERAFSQYPRQGSMGYSLRQDKYRYTLWKGDTVVGEEVYCYDSTLTESKNKAGDADVAEVQSHMRQVVEEHFQLPDSY